MNNTYMMKEILEQPEIITKCFYANQESIEKIANKIKEFNPKNIIIVGRGTSLHAGIYARYLFERFYHVPVSIASQSVFTIYDSTVDFKDSLVIGISQSGKGRDTIKVLAKARQGGALTLAIVNYDQSVLAKTTEYVLTCEAGEVVSTPATKTFTSTLFLLAELVKELTKEPMLQVSHEEIREAIEFGITLKEIADTKAIMFKDYSTLLTLGRGTTLSLAMETALKIEETSRIQATSYPISEFYHGPMSMLNTHIPVILYSLEKETYEDAKGMLERINNKKKEVLLITNDQRLLEYASNHFYIGEQNIVKAYFIATLFMELLTCELAILKGYNPDVNEDLNHIDTY